MTVILNLTWAIVLLPLVGVGASLLAESPRRAAHASLLFTAMALVAALVVLVFRLTHVIPAYENTQTFWDLLSTSARAGGRQLLPTEFPVVWGIRVDPLSVSFMAVVLFLSVVCQAHALVSARGDHSFRRFFWVSGILTFGVLAVISSPNLFQLLLGWMVSGVAAWMLAAHHWQRVTAAAGATRAFVLLRIADIALLAAVVMTFAKFGVSVSQQPAVSGQVSNDPFSFSLLGPQWHLAHVGAVAGTGPRSLVVIALLFLLAATIRAALGPLHVWLSGALEAPAAAVALVTVAALVPAAFLLARVYPLLLEAPQMLTVLALIGSVGAVVGALLALGQRDLFRVGVFAVGSQAGLVFAAFGMGGYSPALFITFTGAFLTVVYFLAAGNLSRGFRSRDLADCGGGSRRMPRTALTLAGWALAISGLSLNTYSVLAAALRNAPPGAAHLDALTQVVVTIAVLLTTALTALYSFRVYFTVSTGELMRRRGFDMARLREVGPRLSRPALGALAGAGAATLVGIPGLSAFTIGSARIPGLTFSHFVFYGPFRQQLAVDLTALLLVAVIGVAGAAAAWWLFSAGRRRSSSAARRPLLGAGTRLAAHTPAERLAAIAPSGFVAAGGALDRADQRLIEPLVVAMGEDVGLVSGQLNRARAHRLAISSAAGLAIVALLLAATVLAATGHLPVTIH